MAKEQSMVRNVLYAVFFVSTTVAVVLGLCLIWGGIEVDPPDAVVLRILGTTMVLSAASALMLSATRILAADRYGA